MILSNNKFKETLLRILLWLNSPLERYISSLNSILSPQSKNLTPLSPTIIKDNTADSYLDSLKEAVQNDDISNIALAGPYGSGKSSIIKTFILRNKHLKILEISLASFKDSEHVHNFSKANENQDFQKLLELSILQQIIYHVKPSRLPDSRIKRIIHFSPWNLFFTSSLIILWVTSIFIIINNGFGKILNPVNWNYEKAPFLEGIMLFSIFFVGLFFLTPKIIRFLNNSKINRISLKGEIDIGKNVDESILNEHFDEVLYFFEKNHFDLIVIEDLDRFDNTQIFSKLREINSLINNSPSCSKKIKFLYAVRDDIFRGEERTKFFDLSIPVIPLINYSNSKAKLKENLQKPVLNLKAVNQNQETSSNAKTSFPIPTDEFIEEVSLFINDMRMLFNISNEYFIYRQTLTDIPDQDKLLALIIYKNMEPEDFNNLNLNTGKLYKFINQKADYIKGLQNEIDFKINKLLKENEDLTHTLSENLEELRSIYVGALLLTTGSPSPSYIDVDGTNINLSELHKEENFEKLRKASRIFGYGLNFQNQASRSSKEYKFDQFENKIHSSLTYEEREEKVKKLTDGKIEKNRKEITSFKNQKLKLSSTSLREILNTEGASKFLPENSDLKNEKLIIFFLRNGYIDEYYHNYISHFYDVDISQDEFKFLLNVINEMENDINQSLSHPKQLINRIPLRYFSQKSILNTNLLEYLLEDQTKYSEQIDSIVILISKTEENSIMFLENFIKNSSKSNILFSVIIKKWHSVWEFIENNNYDENTIRKFFQLILSNSNSEDIKILSNHSDLINFIESNKIGLEYFMAHPNLHVTKRIVTDLNLEFHNISILQKSDNIDFVDFLIENNRYKINIENINFVFQKINKSKSLIPLIGMQNLTCILNSKNDNFIEYIKSEISEYIEQVFFKLEGNTEESESTLKYLMDEEELTIFQKEDILLQSKNIIDNLCEIYDADSKELLLKTVHTKINWENVLDYYSAFGNPEKLPHPLVEFFQIEGVAETLSNLILIDTKTEDDFDIKYGLANAIINNQALKIDIYGNLMNSIKHKWENLEIENISKDQLVILINEHIIILSEDYFHSSKIHSPPLHLTLIQKNWDIYFENPNQYPLEKDEVLTILQNPQRTNLTNKIKFLESLEIDLLVSNKVLAEETISYFNKANRKTTPIFLEKLFKNSSNQNEKISLLNKNIENYSISQIRAIVGKLGGEPSRMVQSLKQAKIKNSTENLKLVKKLEELDIISSHTFFKDEEWIKVQAKK
ncbi:hypothetical protein [Gillisia hiemivivida]|uniref:YobI-like P-loop NTPase domain-containing protein n=1 Tax=Gillisia hiemivivida TaxID=291190 RepID=A0A5C6ZXU2_9FLAO|nr:hypothetical protein [Gillisia hiemivivida]TXD94911.1 hypothetical protein ES724_05435 [Gillisia hiemivivida]